MNVPPSHPPSYTPGDLHPADPDTKASVLHPRVAVLLGVEKHWHFPLLFCRALSTAPAVWWGLRCALTFMGELLMEEGLEAALDGVLVGAVGAPWSVERRFRVTEVFLAVLWVCSGILSLLLFEADAGCQMEKKIDDGNLRVCAWKKVPRGCDTNLWSECWLIWNWWKCCASAYLSFYFTDCLMSRWLLNYTPQARLLTKRPATLVRLLTINSMNAYITSWVLYLSGGSEDPRQLLPAWISIASTLTFLYHLTHPRLAILKETSLSISVFSIASFISMVSLLLQLHLTRENDPPVPLFLFGKRVWEWGPYGAGVGIVERREGVDVG
ncbi:hypothetical protein D0Z07_3204 [Hyphodiscus hymeniophilus]|uniref:Uncharacterized protein n=1 Tax=Hyphodiscus hymeniophilus TaxID=353542 RepID=A0A9P6VM52_9HELO|nr:hypothetical protein D0Z07_3204 [Hyphodiscus hymeniophilus]